MARIGALVLGAGCGAPATSLAPAPAADPGVRHAGRTVSEWTADLVSPDREVAARAIAALRDGDGAAVHVLVAMLASDDPDVPCQAGRILASRGPAVVPVMALLVEHSQDADVRLHAVYVLRSFGPEAALAVPVLTDALFDPDPTVCLEAARTLALIGPDARAAIHPLAAALLHGDWDVRAAAAEALAAIGPEAVVVLDDVVQALGDRVPSVRRGAAQAIAAFGAAAATAVPPLIERLDDDNVYVRQVVIRALGSIGREATAAAAPLRAASADPPVARDAAWALEQITGERTAPTSTTATGTAPRSGRPPPSGLPEADAEPNRSSPRRAGDASSLSLLAPPEGTWPMQGGSPSRNAVVARPVALGLDLARDRGVRFSAALGAETYGSPVVAGGVVLVGTDNEVPRDPSVTGARGVLMAFDAEDGTFLWQDTARSLGRSIDRFLLATTTSTPLVIDDRVYYVTAPGELRCLDLHGFRDGENDGPLRDEPATDAHHADRIWNLDLGGELGVFPHEACNSAVVAAGDLLLLCTANGVDESHANIPAPFAPSFLGVDRHTGEVVWSVVGPSPRVLHGQWSSPALGSVQGRTLAFFGGGDGLLYALEPDTGQEVWHLDANPLDAVWRPGGDVAGRPPRLNLIANPVFHDGRVFAVMGRDPTHGRGVGRVLAVDPGGRGDVTGRGVVWASEAVGRSVCTPIVHAGRVYVADGSGVLHCLKAADGTLLWSHDLLSPVWSCLFAAGDRVHVGDEDGRLTILRAADHEEVLGVHEFDAALYSSPAIAGGVLYLASSRTLHGIGTAPGD